MNFEIFLALSAEKCQRRLRSICSQLSSFFFSHALCVRYLNKSPNEIISWLAFPLAAKIKGKKKNKHSSERNFVFRQKL